MHLTRKRFTHVFLRIDPSCFADFSTHIMLSAVVMLDGLHGGHAVGHVLEELGGACVNVQILLRQMVDGIVQVLVLVWRAKIATSNRALVRKLERNRSKVTKGVLVRV